jgi:hypothetical protein
MNSQLYYILNNQKWMRKKMKMKNKNFVKKKNNMKNNYTRVKKEKSLPK